MASMTAAKFTELILEGLTPRQREVVVGRFGLDKKNGALTLAALGKRYGVTRERVRQIEAAALYGVRENISKNHDCGAFVERCKKHLKDVGGMTSRDEMLEFAASLIQELHENHLNLLSEATGAFHGHEEDKDYRAFFYLNPAVFKNAQAVIQQWVAHLRSKKQKVLAGKYAEEFAAFVKHHALNKDHFERLLSVSKKLHKNPFGDVGLAEWPEVKPHTIRERVYLILKKHGTPLHFQTIAQAINKVGFDARKASAPTVHNELIKDERFVLVGRGMYALSENGYEPGTAREVVHRILKKQGSMRPREIILAIQKERFFKPNTILVNLQNKKYFERLADGTYRIRES